MRDRYGYFEPWAPQIGYVLHEKADRYDALEDDLVGYDSCSEIIPEVPQAHRRKRMLCFIGFEKGKLTHVARGEARYKARTGNDKLDLWKMEKLPRPVSVAKLKRALTGRSANGARAALDGGGHLTPKEFASFMDALKRVDAEAFNTADGLTDRESPERHPLPEPTRENWVLQRDAVVTALDIAGIPRGNLSVPAQPDADTPDDTVSIFDEVGAS